MRRLGTVTHRTHTAAPEVAVALEAFIALERMGWKGARGSSLANDERRLAFARGLVASLAADGRVRADLLAAGDRVLAVLLTLTAGDVAFLWKIAHDPDFAQASPGVQVARMATHGLLNDPEIRLVDSSGHREPSHGRPALARPHSDRHALPRPLPRGRGGRPARRPPSRAGGETQETAARLAWPLSGNEAASARTRSREAAADQLAGGRHGDFVHEFDLARVFVRR